MCIDTMYICFFSKKRKRKRKTTSPPTHPPPVSQPLKEALQASAPFAAPFCKVQGAPGLTWSAGAPPSPQLTSSSGKARSSSRRGRAGSSRRPSTNTGMSGSLHAGEEAAGRLASFLLGASSWTQAPPRLPSTLGNVVRRLEGGGGWDWSTGGDPPTSPPLSDWGGGWYMIQGLSNCLQRGAGLGGVSRWAYWSSPTKPVKSRDGWSICLFFIFQLQCQPITFCAVKYFLHYFTFFRYYVLILPLLGINYSLCCDDMSY